MACSKCKQDEDLKKELFDFTKVDENRVLKLTVIVALLSIYGLFSVVKDIISIFL